MSFLTREKVEGMLLEAMMFEPTESQRRAVVELANLLVSNEMRPTLLVRGYAGTGKTSLMRAFCDVATALHYPLALMAPTGRAAKVLSLATGREAKTIHKTIYRQESADMMSPFGMGYNGARQTIFVVDEASMISDAYGGETEFGSGRLLTDLVSYAFSQAGCKLLLVGDPAQLPPVGVNEAPGLDEAYLRRMGADVRTVWLRDVVRQSKESEILTCASMLREIIENEPEYMGLPRFTLGGNGDVERLTGSELIETLITCQDRYGTENTLVVTRSNKRACRFNLGIRGSVMFKEEELTRGDLVMVAKNNYLWLGEESKDFIANGDIAEVVRINGYSEMYGRRFANVSLRLVEHNDIDIDAMLMLDTLTSETARLSQNDEVAFYESVLEDYADLRTRGERFRALRKDKYFNALQVKFAYAVTCHKAQGGQWDAVFVDIGYVPDEQKTVELLKWLYTAMTRAKKKLYLVNFPDECFE